MKARVKESGEIVEVVHYSGYGDYDYICHENESVYDAEELEFEDDPDYWTRLEHQYAGMAMQGILINEKMTLDLHRAFGKDESLDITISDFAIDLANTLVKKLKEKEERK